MAGEPFQGYVMAKTSRFLRKRRSELNQSRYAARPAARYLRLFRARLGYFWEDFRAWLTHPHIIALLMLVGGMIGLTLDYAYERFFQDAWTLSLENNIFIVMGPEFVSIAIGVLIIDWANTALQQGRQKETLINRLRSQAASPAQDTLDELRASGWLYDGTLESENLSQVNLQGADLRTTVIDELETGDIVRTSVPPSFGNANLRYACLQDAILVGADLSAVDLQSANLNGAQLKDAHLRTSNLRHADCARADLRGVSLEACDMEGANLKDAIIGEPLPRCDSRTKLPDGTYWSSDGDLYRFVDRSRRDFWEPPLRHQTEPQGCDEQERVFS
jgi:hypothetical protein